MNRKQRKQLRSCFGTNEFNTNNQICKRCQHFKMCGKEQRTSYPSLETPVHKKEDVTTEEELVYGEDY